MARVISDERHIMEQETSDQLSTVVDILRAVLSADNTQRKLQEEHLHRLRTNHPHELVLCLLAAARRVPQTEIRCLAAVLLRQMMAANSPSSLWQGLSREVRAVVKTELLTAVATETDRHARRRLGDAVAELAATIFAAQEEPWSSLLPFLFQLSKSAQADQVAAALHIFAELFSFVHAQALQHKAELYTTLSQALVSTDPEVQAGAVEALASFLSTVDNQEIQEFNDLLRPLLLAVFHLIEQNASEAKTAAESLVTIAETEPKFYCESVDILLEFMQKVFSLQTDSGVKSLILETVVHTVGRKPKLLLLSTDRCVKVLEAVFSLMCSVEPTVDPGWLHPPEGFQDRDIELEDAEDIDYAKTGRRLVVRLLETVGEGCLLPLVLQAVRHLLEDSVDWRKKYTALLTLSQLGPFIAEPEKVTALIPILQSHSIPSLHPKIKYAAHHCVAHFCEDLEDDFRDPHHCELAVMLQTGMNDTAPRVVAQAVRAATGFFSSCSQEVAAAHSAAMLEKLKTLLRIGAPSIVLESSLTALAAIADADKEQFAEQADTLIPLFIQLIQTYTTQVYTQLRGKVIDCISLMCSAVGHDGFLPYASSVISLLTSIQDEQMHAEDPQVSSLLTAWQRLCITLREEFSVYLPQIVPGLLALAAPIQESIQGNLNVDDKVVAMETLLTIVDTLQGRYTAYVQPTLQLTLSLVHYSLNEDIRSVSAGIAGALVTVVRLSGLTDAQTQSAALARVVMQAIHPVLMREFDTDALVSQLHSLKSCIETPGFPHLSASEVSSLGQELAKLLMNFLEKRTDNSGDSDEEGDDKLLHLEIDRLHTSLSEVFGALLRTHTDSAVSLARYLYDHVLRLVIDPTATDEDHKFALRIIGDIVEFIGPQRVPDQWPSLCEALLRYSTSESDSVRQAACYGLGQLAYRTSPSEFCNYSASVLQALSVAISLPLGKSARAHGQARDHALAALGRVIHYQGNCIDYAHWVSYWVRKLPLKYDKTEARVAHDMLADITTQQVPNKGELLPQIVRVFGDVLETKLLAAHTVPKVKVFFQQLRQAPPAVWSNLTDQHKRRIAALIEH